MKSVLRIAVGVFLLTSPASATTYEAVDGNRIIVLDGDTVALPCKTPGPGCSERIRLLDIDAPEVDQQLAAARADLQTARANQQLAATTATRWQTMLGKDAVSKQETDEKVGDLAAKSAVASSFGTAFWWAMIISALGFIPALLLPRRPKDAGTHEQPGILETAEAGIELV